MTQVGEALPAHVVNTSDVQVYDHIGALCRIVSPTAHFLTLITPAGFESFFEDSGIALQQDFHGEVPIPGPLSPEGGAALQAILKPLGCTITGPPPFAPE